MIGKSFGKSNKKDTEYMVTMRNGEVIRIPACRVVPLKTDNGVLLYFHSNDYTKEPVILNADDILMYENNGKVVSVPELIVGIVCGGCAGGVVYTLCKGFIACTIKNAILNKVATVVIIGGTIYVVSAAVGSLMADTTHEFTDALSYTVNDIKDRIKKNKPDSDIKEVNDDEDN